jgi:transcriptional regulator with PAS, ATPase and Fis domain
MHIENIHIPIKDKIVVINNANIVVSVDPLFHSGKFSGAIILLKNFDELENKHYQLRNSIIKKGHYARYNFQDIEGKSDIILNVKEVAKKMAKSKSNVLITGESGTGKELFAQSIHNHSARKEYPFVAVNCSTFQPGLLESELFGYDDGAFTGARKGGKTGLFELAHMGTIFLDEISEMPIALQAKLLRVLQERQIIKVGGDCIIDINVRVICATNKDIPLLISQNKFREDLYYRLNIIPLQLPPLRERKEDIMIIFESIKRNFETQFDLTKIAKQTIINNPWKGNVRELVSCVEYLAQLEKPIIDIIDLPPTITKDKNYSPISTIFELQKDFNVHNFLLNEIFNASQKNSCIGRRSLSKIAYNNGIFLSEQEVRSILLELQDDGYIVIHKGRKGNTITSLGITQLNK